MPVFAALVACGGSAPPEGPPHECTYYESEVTYSVGVVVPPVDAGSLCSGALCTPVCLPSGTASIDSTGHVNCTLLLTLPQLGGESICTGSGFEVPDATALSEFLQNHPGALGHPTCLAPQLLGHDLDATGSCMHTPRRGWCYVTGPAAEPCAQTIFTSNASVVPGGLYVFRCSQGC